MVIGIILAIAFICMALFLQRSDAEKDELREYISDYKQTEQINRRQLKFLNDALNNSYQPVTPIHYDDEYDCAYIEGDLKPYKRVYLGQLLYVNTGTKLKVTLCHQHEKVLRTNVDGVVISFSIQTIGNRHYLATDKLGVKLIP